MPELKVIADYGDLCGEGPLWDFRSNQLYWTDITGQKFYCYDWTTRKHRLVKEGWEVSGCAFNAPGGYVVVNSAGVWLWDGAGEPRLVAAEADGNKCQMNDCIADSAGRLVAGSYFYDPSKEYPLGKLFSVATDGKVRVVDEGFHIANGLGFSPDGKTLYFTDSAARIIYAYDYDVATGTPRNRRVFVKVPNTSGLPDGLTVDAAGFVWSAEWYGSCIVRYDPAGKVELRIATPAKQTSSLAFGGPDLTDIFITSAGKSEPMPVMPPGYDPNTGYFGGALYHVNLGVPGRKEHLANIRLAS
ncbi:MAG: SMP-30/gluconolactonase/LRE family protein [Terriglobia bacterium]